MKLGRISWQLNYLEVKLTIQLDASSKPYSGRSFRTVGSEGFEGALVGQLVSLILWMSERF